MRRGHSSFQCARRISGTTSTADAGTVEFSAYNNDGYGYYKTLAVKFADGRWQVVKTLKHVSMQG